MKNLPVNQIGKSQRVALKEAIEPDAKVVQTDFRGQACLKSRQGMWTLTSQAEGIEQFFIHRFDQLPQMSQPAAPFFGPSLLTALMGRSNHLGIKTSAPYG